MKIQITISYQLKNEKDPNQLILTPENYYDLLEGNEIFDADGIPRYNHACEYLKINPKDLIWTELLVEGTTNDHRIREDYFSNGESSFTHRKNNDNYEEIISNTKIGPNHYHILRTHKSLERPWTVNYNGIIEDLPDGSQQEIRIDNSHFSN